MFVCASKNKRAKISVKIREYSDDTLEMVCELNDWPKLHRI